VKFFGQVLMQLFLLKYFHIFRKMFLNVRVVFSNAIFGEYLSCYVK